MSDMISFDDICVIRNALRTSIKFNEDLAFSIDGDDPIYRDASSIFSKRADEQKALLDRLLE